jgi:hypothetical protein
MTLDFENIDDFFKLVEFATVATLPGGVNINVIFDRAHTAVDGGMYEIGSSIPLFIAKSSDVATLSQGAQVIINDVSYSVRDLQPDGTGITEVYLHVYA